MWMWVCSCGKGGQKREGFTLVEVLVATALLSGGFMAVAQLVVLSSRSNVLSRDISYSGTLASQKLHELSARDIASLPLSPPDAWMRTTAEAVEYIDLFGVVVASGEPPPGSAVYVRRWSIMPGPGDPTGGVVIQVAAGRLRLLASGAAADAIPADVARVVGIKTGRVP